MQSYFPLEHRFRWWVAFVIVAILVQPGSLAAQSLLRIPDIQGSAERSAKAGQWVDTFGLVTALTEDGFYLQDPVGDDDEKSSDGIYVYLHRTPKVKLGDCLFLQRAYVDEFNGKTELSRMKSVEPSDRCHGQAVQPVSIPIARLYSDPEVLFERYEGMLVEVDNLSAVVQGSTKRFGNGEAEMALVEPVSAVQLAGGRVFQAQPEQTSALIFISSALGADFPDARWGDRVAVGKPEATGRKALAILDYNFGKYQLLLLPDQSVDVSAQPPPQPERASPTKADEITVCSTNLWALGRGSAQHPNPLDFDQELKKRAKAIAETLFGCTIIGLQEVGSQAVLDDLTGELRTHYGLDYAGWAGSGYQADNPEFPLTTGFLMLKSRVTVNAVEMIQRCTSTDYKVLPGAMQCTQGEFLLFDRPSLIADVMVSGDWGEPFHLRVVSNHLKSKAGDETINEPRRILQAQEVASHVQRWLDADAAAAVVVLGDMNDYYSSDPVEMLRTTITPPLFHVYSLLPYLDRYTYVYNGASQVLDHILVSQALQPRIGEVNVLHINSNFAYPETADLSTVIHASDHDPVLLRLRPAAAATLGLELGYPAIEAALSDATGTLVDRQQSDDRGDVRFWNLRPGRYTVHLSLPSYLMANSNDFVVDLEDGQNDLPPLQVEHSTVRLIKSAIEAVPALLSREPM